MTGPTSLTREQYEWLTAKIAPSRVKKTQGMSHLEAWDVRRHLIRFFGFGGWDYVVVNCDLVKEIQHETRTKTDKNGREYEYTPWTVVYRVIGRLTIKTPVGTVLAVYEDGATGDAVNQPSLGDAHDMALKTALSQSLKRCAANLGDQFGLSLYDKGSTEPTVLRSFVAPPASEPEEGSGDDGAIESD